MNKVSEVFNRYMENKEMTLLHKGRVIKNCDYPQPGMAIRHKTGVIMRIMNRFTYHEDYSIVFTLAAVNIKPENAELFSYNGEYNRV